MSQAKKQNRISKRNSNSKWHTASEMVTSQNQHSSTVKLNKDHESKFSKSQNGHKFCFRQDDKIEIQIQKFRGGGFTTSPNRNSAMSQNHTFVDEWQIRLWLFQDPADGHKSSIDEFCFAKRW